jgi:hypothetical protein
MDFESSVRGTVTAERAVKAGKHALEDLLYTVMGDASPANMLVMVFAIIFFGATPVAMLMLFGTYSGGMRWLITLGTVTAMGFVAVYLMRRGLERRRAEAGAAAPQTEFRGQLTDVTDAMRRASSGYVYSQQVLRERLCEDIVNRAGMLRDLDPDEMARMLDRGDASFVGDEALGRFLLANRRGAASLDEAYANAEGKSAERGSKFMQEIDTIIGRMEALT